MVILMRKALLLLVPFVLPLALLVNVLQHRDLVLNGCPS